MRFDKVVDRKGTFCTQWDYVKDRFGKDDLLPFTISDMDFESPEEIVEVLQKRISHKVFGYSRWNHTEFKGSVVNWYKKRFNTNIEEDWIVYSPSVIYSVSKFIELWSNDGDGVLINTPSYDAFYKVIESNNRKVIKSSLTNIEGDFKIDFKDFELKCKEAKIFLLCNPQNPTGKVWTRDELVKLIEICRRNNVKIISDDIHMDITYGRRYEPVLGIYSGDDIVICSSTSKSFNIPALTGSYILIPGNEVRERFLTILKNRDGLSSPSILNVIGTITAYNKCEYWMDELVSYTYDNITFVKEYIQKNIPKLKVNMPEGLYFAWINFEELGVESDELQKVLINEGKVAIMPGLTYGEEGRYYLRFNVACSRRKVVDGLERLKVAIESLPKN